MPAKLTAKNQITLPKTATAAVEATEYFEVETRDGSIVLTPVRLQRGDAVRAKRAELGLTERDVDEAVRWARGAAGIAEERARYRPESPSRTRRNAKTGRTGPSRGKMRGS